MIKSVSGRRPGLRLTLASAVSTLAAGFFSLALGQSPHPLGEAERGRIESLIQRMTLQQKFEYIGGTGFGVRGMPALGIPPLKMSDGPYGTRSNSGFPSTTYAAGVGLAASWDRELASRVGAGIGRDARARGVHFMLGPGMNIYRSPRNGRNFEYFGEDPFLAGQIAAGYIEGMQGQGVAATAKHYMGNNSEYLRHDSDSVIDERAMREIYLPAFETSVKDAHVSAVMDSYNLINGKHATQNSYLNTQIMRDQWHFAGVMMSDWDATYDAIGAANGGLDIEMPTGKFMNEAALAPAVKSGSVKEETINAKVRHILTVAMSFGWLDRNQQDNSISFLDARNSAAALDSARESVVLLKNSGNVLPLTRASMKTVLVVGPDAYPAVPVGGGSAGVVPFHAVSHLEGITNLAGPGVTVLYDAGVPTVAQLAKSTHLATAADNREQGVMLETYGNGNLEGRADSTAVMPRVALTGLSFKLLIANLDSAMDTLFASKPKPKSHRFTGYYMVSKAGKFTVSLEGSNEGSGNRVFVDGREIIDNWKLVRATQDSVELELAAGAHKVVVEEYQIGPVGGHLLFAMVPSSELVTPETLKLAAKADAVVVSAGFQQESETEGGDRSFGLPFGQAELINSVAAVNPKTIVAVTAGGNVDSRSWLEHVPALLQTWYGGQAGGTALGEILFGDVNPSGHLPMTFEKRPEDNPTFANYYPQDDSKKVEYKEGIFVGYRGYEKGKIEPEFPFGFGLSYTTFRFSNLKVSQTPTGGAVHMTATFDVTNTGQRKGADVVQLYVTETHPVVPRPAHELKGFERVELEPGQTRHVSIALDPRAFSYYDVMSSSWKIGSSHFKIAVGESLASLPLSTEVTLAGVAQQH